MLAEEEKKQNKKQKTKHVEVNSSCFFIVLCESNLETIKRKEISDRN